MAYNKSDDHLYVFREDQGYKWQQLKYDDVTIEPWECGDEMIDFRDQNIYETVKIGEQCWMAENLNTGDRIDGIFYQTDNQTIEKYCYDDNEDNCDTYGGLYQWEEAMQYATTKGSQGICPEGWHIPTDEELKQLEGEVDTQYNYPDPEWDDVGWRGHDAGLNLKSTADWTNNGNGTDLYGFSALPGGYRYLGDFTYLGYLGIWWSSTENSALNAWSRALGYSFGQSNRLGMNKDNGYSVRCLRD
nr:hypothetical protein [Bacteroidota bacterium]